MYNSSDRLIYVGKAKSLKKRVCSYFNQKKNTTTKTAVMMSHCEKIEFTVTETENEALLLEANLIKQHRPRYNVLLRDDKSYPYLYLSTRDDFPRLDLFRGTVDAQGHYYGPFSGATAVRNNLQILQKVFKLRQCSNGFFKSRKKPCLQYQIDCCTAPCVGKVSLEGYADQVNSLRCFLNGKDDSLMCQLQTKMEACSNNKAYEKAAMYRDQIAQLRTVMGRQSMVVGQMSADVFALSTDCERHGVAVLFVRNGRVLGHKSFFLRALAGHSGGQILSDFISQYYLRPSSRLTQLDRIITTEKLEDKDWLQNALADFLGAKLKIIDRPASHYRDWCTVAFANAQEHLKQKTNDGEVEMSMLFEGLSSELQLSKTLYQIECFDVSHTYGAATVASCVVCDTSGIRKDLYRKFNIKDVTPGDDYAAMEQVLRRRYQGVIERQESLPDLIMVDGGLGQMAKAAVVIDDLGMCDTVLVGVAKGRSRKPGDETIWVHGQPDSYTLELSSNAMKLIQMIRDEAHRFAISGHRKKRRQLALYSELESIPGIGKKHRQVILNYFGGRQGLMKASMDELLRVPGIGQAKAGLLFEYIKSKKD